MDKGYLRLYIQSVLGAQPASRRAKQSKSICEGLLALPRWRAARSVMVFIPLPDEPDLRPLIRAALEEGKAVYAPHTPGRGGLLKAIRLMEMDLLRSGRMGVEEPVGEPLNDLAVLDLILVPGRAFDRQGNRLGRGAGYYDRFLAQPAMRASTCGVVFACQITDHVPHTETDIPVQMIVTDAEVIRCSSG